MNKIYLALFCLLSFGPISTIAQDAIQQPTTKLDKFTSKSGVIIKFEDYRLTRLSLDFGEYAESRVRKIYSGGEIKLFYQISNAGKYGSKTASVAAEDFIEVNKALASLKAQLVTDLKSPADYLENKYATEDGLHLGYLINKGKETWYIRLEKYGSGGTIFLKSVETIEESFNQAALKLNELK